MRQLLLTPRARLGENEGHAGLGQRGRGVPERQDVIRQAERTDGARLGAQETDSHQPERQHGGLYKKYTEDQAFQDDLSELVFTLTYRSRQQE